MSVSPRDDEVTAAEPGKYKQAMVNTALSVSAAVAFGAGIGVMEGSTKALEFFAGYVVEQSLSVDNIFVFLLLFEYFKVPLPYQDRVLKWGIIGAVVMRGAFIAVGKAALEQFEPVLLVFAGILLVSAFKLLTEGDEQADEDLADNQIVALSRKLLQATDEYDGDNFFTMVSFDALLSRSCSNLAVSFNSVLLLLTSCTHCAHKSALTAYGWTGGRRAQSNAAAASAGLC
jgi:TerC family integral membrane protein